MILILTELLHCGLGNHADHSGLARLYTSSVAINASPVSLCSMQQRFDRLLVTLIIA